MSATTVAAPHPLALPGFARNCAGLLRGHLDVVRLARGSRPDLAALRQRPLLIYLNRASWWDPLVCLHLAAHHLPQRRHFAPVERAVLEQFPLFGRLGFFPLDTSSAWGVRRLLTAAQQVFRQPDAVLWVAPAGAPADPRCRPARLPAGLSHLASRLQHGVLLPLAVEYPFWSDRRPEALLRFGEELAVEDAGMRARDWADLLTTQLDAAQTALAAAAVERDPAAFEVLGTARPAGRMREAWQRLRRVGRGSPRSEP